MAVSHVAIEREREREREKRTRQEAALKVVVV